jgi:hypothetical protein
MQKKFCYNGLLIKHLCMNFPLRRRQRIQNYCAKSLFLSQDFAHYRKIKHDKPTLHSLRLHHLPAICHRNMQDLQPQWQFPHQADRRRRELRL